MLSTARDPLTTVLLRTVLLIASTGLLVRGAIAAWMVPDVTPLTLGTAFVQGFGADLLMAAGAMLLLTACALATARLLLIALAMVSGAVVLLVIAELFFWNEFQSRPDRLVFHYLSYPREVLTFLEDQFYLSLFLIPYLLVCTGVHWWLRQPLRNNHLAGRGRAPGPWLLVVTTTIVGVALYTLTPAPQGRISEQLASNALLGISSAAMTNVSKWQGHYPAATGRPSLPPFRRQRPWADPPKHLVLIIEESFAGPTWQDPALRARYLPETAALAQQGWSFSNAFATGSRTTRGMEALLNGMPPLPGVSTTQRPSPERLPSLPRALANQGWHTAFIYAGWPGFSNLTNYWRAIGFADSTSRYDFEPSPNRFETSWGYADETLFKRVLAEMQERTRSHDNVFLAALTVSHHRPFDYPDGRIAFPAHERRSEHAMAYADWALGAFMRAAARTDWYPQTLFVIAADHGVRLRGNASVPINSYRVPLIMIAPGRTEPRQWPQLVSTMEVPGTVLDLLQMEDTEGFYGTHMLDAAHALAPVEHDYDVGLIDANGVTVLRRDAPSERWQWQSNQTVLAPAATDPTAMDAAITLFEQAHQRYFGAP